MIDGMILRHSAFLTLAAAVVVCALTPVRLDAQADTQAVIRGQCLYSERTARYKDQTTLVICDTVQILRTPTGTALDFGRKSWGTTAVFDGIMPDDRLTVSQVRFRNGEAIPASGDCRIYRRNDASLATIACLAKAGTRWIAANFVASQI